MRFHAFLSESRPAYGDKGEDKNKFSHNIASLRIHFGIIYDGLIFFLFSQRQGESFDSLTQSE